MTPRKHPRTSTRIGSSHSRSKKSEEASQNTRVLRSSPKKGLTVRQKLREQQSKEKSEEKEECENKDDMERETQQDETEKDTYIDTITQLKNQVRELKAEIKQLHHKLSKSEKQAESTSSPSATNLNTDTDLDTSTSATQLDFSQFEQELEKANESKKATLLKLEECEASHMATLLQLEASEAMNYELSDEIAALKAQLASRSKASPSREAPATIAEIATAAAVSASATEVSRASNTTNNNDTPMQSTESNTSKTSDTRIKKTDQITSLQTQLQKSQAKIIEYSYKFIKLDSETSTLRETIATLERQLAHQNFKPLPEFIRSELPTVDTAYGARAGVGPGSGSGSGDELRQEYEMLTAEYNLERGNVSKLTYELELVRAELFQKEQELEDFKARIDQYVGRDTNVRELRHRTEIEEMKESYEVQVRSLQSELTILKQCKDTQHDDGSQEMDHKQLKRELEKLKFKLKIKDTDHIKDLQKVGERHTAEIKRLKLEYFDKLMGKIDEQKARVSPTDIVSIIEPDIQQDQEVSVLDKLLSQSETLASQTDSSKPQTSIDKHPLEKTPQSEPKPKKSKPNPKFTQLSQLSLTQAEENIDLLIKRPAKPTQISASKLLKQARIIPKKQDAVLAAFTHFTLGRRIPFMQYEQTTSEDGLEITTRYCCEICLEEILALVNHHHDEEGETLVLYVSKKHRCSGGSLIHRNVKAIERSLDGVKSKEEIKEIISNYQEMAEKLEQKGSIYTLYLSFAMGLRTPKFNDQFITMVRFLTLNQSKLFLPDPDTVEEHSMSQQLRLHHFTDSFVYIYTQLMFRVFMLSKVDFVQELEDFLDVKLDLDHVKREWETLVDMVGKGSLKELKVMELVSEEQEDE